MKFTSNISQNSSPLDPPFLSQIINMARHERSSTGSANPELPSDIFDKNTEVDLIKHKYL